MAKEPEVGSGLLASLTGTAATAMGVPLKQHPNHGCPCDEAVRSDTGCMDAVVEEALHEQVAGDVDEGHEGSYVERLALHVERAQEAESAG